MPMQELINILSYKLFSIQGQEYTALQVLALPIVIWLAYYFIKISSAYIINKLKLKEVDPDLILLVHRLYFIVGLLLLGFTTLALLNVPLGAFAFVSGAVAIGVGFGAQNIINNFISGWILMWEKPIRIGDFLELGDVMGNVETINTRSTLIRRTDGVHMLIPNSHLLENTVVNWTLIDKQARGMVRVGVAYGSPVKQVAELIEQAVKSHDLIMKDPEPSVIFEDFGDNALIFDTFFWVSTVSERGLRFIKSDVRFKIEELFNQNDIVIAYPQRDVHIDGELKITKPGL
ncbi:mechanosensitive ion channel [Gammaproteobacteria bacterium]|nr:mechanosensitive ion channel [Gammaproteobacteria bacterium]